MNDTVYLDIPPISIGLDLNKDGTDDISFTYSFLQSAGGSIFRDCQLKSFHGFEVLADSFTYHYCCDTVYTMHPSFYDTLITRKNCDNPDSACLTVTKPYILLKSDCVFPTTGFYSNNVYLFDEESIYLPGWRITRSYSSKEGEFRNHASGAYIFLRNNNNGTFEYYAIKTETESYSTRFYLKRIIRY